ncbi:MAG: hypothetical protein MK077_05365 [Phycisphaerales bacterium]|nr:hypothetical protein [Phycisphaerales bacterium]
MPDSRERSGASVSPARVAALSHLAVKASRWPDIYPTAMPTTGLSVRDARLAEAIDRAATIRWLTLKTIIEPLLSRPWNQQAPEVIAALLGGAAQILLLDRIPDHAAIGESVGWCKTTKAVRASGVVNAVLRKVIALRGEKLDQAGSPRADVLIREDGSGWTLNTPVFDGEPRKALAAQCGLHHTWLERIAGNATPEQLAQQALHSISKPPVVLHHAGPHEALIDHSIAGFQVLQPGNHLGAVLEAYPNAIVQDSTAAAAVRATSAMAPTVALDRCAGRGTKSRQLARQHPSARIVACDTHAGRIKELQQLPEVQSGRIEVAGANPPESLRGQVDLLLLDVPCTNTGVLARRPEARHRTDMNSRTALRDLQRQIAADALPWLSPRGTLVWTTCSIEPEENEAQIEWLTQWHPLQVVTMAAHRGTGTPGDAPSAWTDGGFFALLRHRD